MPNLDPYQRFSDDPTRHKHHGELTSQMAWEKARTRRAECQQEVLDALRSVYPDGLTCKELSAVLNKAMHKISGRITELLEDGLVEKGEVRNGGRVIYMAAASQSRSEHSPQDQQELRASQRQLILDKANSGDYWGAIRLSVQYNITVRVELDPVQV